MAKKGAKKSKGLKAKARCVIGIDIGGTNIVSVIVDRGAKVVAKVDFPTEGAKGPDYVIRNMAKNVKAMTVKAGLSHKDIAFCGIGSPGPLDSKKGIIMGAVNLPGWKRVMLKDKMEKLLGVPVGVDNDANCAVYGEVWAGAAKGAKNVTGLTLGTGVGGGIIIDGRLVRGANYNAAEIGHTSLNPDGRECKCGAKGCFEQYASASAIAESAREGIRNGRRSLITEFVRGDMTKITSKTVYDALVQGDKYAQEVWSEFIKYLGAGIANIINGLNPEVVVIAGGVIEAGDRLFKPLNDAVRRQTFSLTFSAAKIVPAKLGGLAGAIGAAGLVINESDFYGL
ncbi:MAG TPA: ROK family protein [bacterium]|nr:ROK family protein [bacterium]